MNKDPERPEDRRICYNINIAPFTEPDIMALILVCLRIIEDQHYTEADTELELLTKFLSERVTNNESCQRDRLIDTADYIGLDFILKALMNSEIRKS
jgi:hypothetical protein